ncbi:MAG: glucans biosynthesis protein [Paracoccaceae bacterium]|jgi:glucans biosynthesis protein
MTTEDQFLFSRRALLGAGGAFLATAPGAAFSQTEPALAQTGFGMRDVVEFARARAAKPYAAARQKFTGIFADLDYDKYRSVRPRAEARLWRDESLGFEADLLPPGAIFRDPVFINMVEDGVARPLPFDAGSLHFGAPAFDLPDGRAPDGSGAGLAWSGFRLRCPLNRPDVLDEVAVFQGASYFRAVARGQVYGLSARGLAIKTGAPEGEEFPVFTDFWLHRPDPDANEMRFQALLDSPSLTGAYDFTLRPGADTTIDVRAVLFARTEVAEVGVAPLTSMYFFGAKERGQVDDYRDAAHDSDGLQMLNGRDERIWRPLSNPRDLQLSTFVDQSPKGFGLVQRRRDFADFQDAEARYDLRPSAWVTPAEDWDKGAVVLVEIPTDSEFNDNIVAYWRSAMPLIPDAPRRIGYRLHFSDMAPDGLPTARVAETRAGRDISVARQRVLVVDFDLADRTVDALIPRAEAAGVELIHVGLRALPGAERARVAITFTPPSSGTAEFRLTLAERDGGAAASETWLYRWSAR